MNPDRTAQAVRAINKAVQSLTPDKICPDILCPACPLWVEKPKGCYLNRADIILQRAKDKIRAVSPAKRFRVGSDVAIRNRCKDCGKPLSKTYKGVTGLCQHCRPHYRKP